MKRFICLIAILILAANSFAQGHFIVAFSGKGQDHMNITVITATLAGVDLKAGDEIAAFDGTICCGKAILDGPINITSKITFAAIAASRQDEGMSNGYTIGNPISYKYWDSANNREISLVTAEYFDPETGLPVEAPTFQVDGSAFVKLSVAANRAPVANAGDDQTVNEGATVTLDGSGSTDPDSDPLTYKWTAPAGLTLSSDIDQKPTFTAPDVAIDTEYTFSLVVNDGKVDSPADQVKVMVKAVAENQPPVANTGDDQTVNEGATVTLDGSGSTDPDSDPLTYKWTAPAGITLSSDTDQKPTFTAPNVAIDTEYTFSLVVNDGKVDSPADQVKVTVKAVVVNQSPVANAGDDQTVNEGATVTLDGSGSSDPDSDPLTYKWTAPAGITLSSDTDQKPTFTAPDVAIDTEYTFSLVVNDGKVDSPADQVKVMVKMVAENQPPVANAGDDQTVNEGATVTLDGSGSSDPDSDPLTYKWTAPAGITLSSDTDQKPTFTAPDVAIDTEYTFTLVVNDGKVDSPADQVKVMVKAVAVNQPPVANAGDDQTVNEGATVTLDGSGSSDPDSDPLTYKWTAPAGITLSSDTDQKPTFTAPDVAIDTEYTFSLVVNDGKVDSPADQVKVMVKAVAVNQPPVANAGDDQTVNEGATVTLDSSGSTDPDSDPLTYKWTAPAGITLSSDTDQKPTFTAPDVAIDTEYTFSLMVNDGKVDSPADQVKVMVKAVAENQPPVANAGADQTLNEGATVTLDGSGSTDPDSDPLTYKWTAPAGITLSSDTEQKPTFTAPDVEIDTEYTFSLVVNDGKVDSPADQVKVMVKAVAVNQPPVACAGPDQIVNEGNLGTLDGSCSYDPDNRMAFSWALPGNTQFSSPLGIKMTVTGPALTTNTNYNFSMMLLDGLGGSSTQMNWIVPSGVKFSSTTVSFIRIIPPVGSGGNYSFEVKVYDGSAPSDPNHNGMTYFMIPATEFVMTPTTIIKMDITAPEATPLTNQTFLLEVSDATNYPAPGPVFLTQTWQMPSGITLGKTTVAMLKIVSPNATNTDFQFTFEFNNGLGMFDPALSGLTYRWIAPPGITLSSETDPKPTFTAPEVNADTDYKFYLIVNDGTSDSPPEEVIVKVNHVNKAPVANAGTDQAVPENTLVTLDGSGSSDPDNDALTYHWTAPSGIVLSSPNDQKPTFVAPDVNADTELKFNLVVNDGTVDSPADQVIITIQKVNQAPTAHAGADQSANENTLVTLDGSASTDPENDPLTYKWTAPSGIVLSSETNGKPTFTAPEVVTDTDFKFILMVNDGQYDSPADEVIVTVMQVNKLPVANAGNDLSVNEGAVATLDGSASSDADGDPLTFKWTAPPGIILSSDTNAKPTFTAPQVSADTQYTFSLVVNDGTEDSPADEVLVTVLNMNIAPQANAGTDQSANEGTTVTLDGSASSDADGDPLTYKWTAPPGFSLSSDSDVKPTFTAPQVSSDTQYTFSLVVNDGTIDSPADEVVITVLQVNKAPVANAGNDHSVNEGAVATLDGSASSDPDGDPLTYKWTAPPGFTLSSDSDAKPTFTAPQVSSDTQYTFSLVVNDGTVDSPADEVVITVENVDHAPYVKNAIADVSVLKGAPDMIIDLKNIFADDDPEDVLTFTVIITKNPSVVTPNIIGTNLVLNFSTGNIGTTEVVVKANSNGKEVETSFKVDVQLPTNVELLGTAPDIQVYPNPTFGKVTLKFSELSSAKNLVSVYDLTGKLVHQSFAESKLHTIDLSGNIAGVYFVKAEQSPKVYKLILK